jgi:hypothetical protein
VIALDHHRVIALGDDLAVPRRFDCHARYNTDDCP